MAHSRQFWEAESRFLPMQAPKLDIAVIEQVEGSLFNIKENMNQEQ